MPRPPNNPSKQPQPKSKRTRTTSPSGWTHIIKGPTPHLPHPQTTALQQQQKHHQEQSTSTLEPHITRFKTHYLPQWRASTCWASLSLLFKNEIIPSLPPKDRVTNCVCLGLGSLTSNGTSSSTSASWYQLAALISIIELLLVDTTSPDDSNTQFPITFQDPIFTLSDEIFLATHLPSFFLPLSPTNNNQNPVPVEVSVVRDPDAFSRIGKETFLFTPHLEVGVFARALEGEGGEEGPVCCIGSDVGSYVDGLLSKHAESARPGSVDVFRRFRNGRQEREMPGFERGNWCFALRVYWRDGDGRGDGEGVEEIVREMEGQRL